MSLRLKYKLEFNFIIYLVGKIISAGVIIGSIPLFIKYFGIKVYGEFIYFYTSFLMLFAGSTGWIVQGILRFYTLENNRKKMKQEIDQMSFRSFLVSSLIIVGFFIYSKADAILIALAVLSLFFSLFYTTKLTIEQALLKSTNYIIADISRSLSFLATPLIIYYAFPYLNGLHVLFFGVLLSYITSLMILSNFKIVIPKFNLNFKMRWSKIFLKYGLPLSIWLFFSPTTNGADRYVIEFSIGTILLAKYTAIFDIVFKMFSSLATPFNAIAQPLLIKNYNDRDFSEYRKTMYKSILYLTGIFVIFLMVVLIFQKFIICKYLNFCGDYDLLSKLIIPFATSSYIWQIAVLLQKNMEVSNKTIEMTIYMLIVVTVIIVLGIIFVPIYGLLGSAYISLLASIIYFALIIYGTKKHFKK